MKNQELFNKSVGILVNSYRNDTLQHNDCCSCAVGNLIASACNYTITKDFKWLHESSFWSDVFFTTDEGQTIYKSQYYGEAKKQIDSTGYSLQELAKIEFAFESANQGVSEDDYMFNGLLDVYDVLCDIHEMDKEEVIKGELIFVK